MDTRPTGIEMASQTLDAWMQAVDLGARGRYICAWHRLECIDERDAMASQAHSTWGSHYRQIGALDLARRHDERAVELAEDDLAAGDAWIGLAADAIAEGAATRAAEHLCRVAEVLGRLDDLGCVGDSGDSGDAGDAQTVDVDSNESWIESVQRPWRIRVRAAWVTSELALLNDDANSAVDHARIAMELSATRSARHRLKSEAVLAASLVASGRADEAARICDRLGVEVARLGWVSLMWPVALIAVAAGQAAPKLEVSTDLVRQGAWATRLIEAHLPSGRYGSHPGDLGRAADLAAHWGERRDIAHLRALSGRSRQAPRRNPSANRCDAPTGALDG